MGSTQAARPRPDAGAPCRAGGRRLFVAVRGRNRPGERRTDRSVKQAALSPIDKGREGLECHPFAGSGGVMGLVGSRRESMPLDRLGGCELRAPVFLWGATSRRLRLAGIALRPLAARCTGSARRDHQSRPCCNPALARVLAHGLLVRLKAPIVLLPTNNPWDLFTVFQIPFTLHELSVASVDQLAARARWGFASSDARCSQDVGGAVVSRQWVHCDRAFHG